MRIWKTSLDMECDRLRAVADEIQAVDDWFCNIGRKSTLDTSFGYRQENIEEALTGYQLYSRVNRFYQETSDHIHTHFPMNPRWFFEADPVSEMIDFFDQIAPNMRSTLEKQGRACFEFFEHDHAQGAYFDLKMYAVTFSFLETPVINETEVPNYYTRAYNIMRAGHFPCGWTRKFKPMSNRWKKGHFIYI